MSVCLLVGITLWLLDVFVSFQVCFIVSEFLALHTFSIGKRGPCMIQKTESLHMYSGHAAGCACRLGTCNMGAFKLVSEFSVRETCEVNDLWYHVANVIDSTKK